MVKTRSRHVSKAVNAVFLLVPSTVHDGFSTTRLWNFPFGLVSACWERGSHSVLWRIFLPAISFQQRFWFIRRFRFFLVNGGLSFSDFLITRWGFQFEVGN